MIQFVVGNDGFARLRLFGNLPNGNREIGFGTDGQDLINLNSWILAVTGISCRIGPATAQAIVDYLAVNGDVTTLNELLPVRNFTATTVACLVPHTVQPAS